MSKILQKCKFKTNNIQFGSVDELVIVTVEKRIHYCMSPQNNFDHINTAFILWNSPFFLWDNLYSVLYRAFIFFFSVISLRAACLRSLVYLYKAINVRVKQAEKKCDDKHEATYNYRHTKHFNSVFT